jgi:hypothetical protein
MVPASLLLLLGMSKQACKAPMTGLHASWIVVQFILEDAGDRTLVEAVPPVTAVIELNSRI